MTRCAAESWRGRCPASDSPRPHGASGLTSRAARCGISLLQLHQEQQPHLSPPRIEPTPMFHTNKLCNERLNPLV
ncbi:unnamed protein product [Gadus morhua 'NCC']